MRMRKLRRFLVLAAFFTPNVMALTVGGVSLEDSIAIQGTALKLNGAGIRNKLFIDVYVAGLYLPERTQVAQRIIDGNEVQSIRLVVTSSQITRDRLIDAITEGIKMSAGKEFPRYEPRLQELWATLTFEIGEGDIFDFTYVPGEGTHVIRNGQPLRVMPEYEFKRVLFGIWLGKDPIQESLKADLLDS